MDTTATAVFICTVYNVYIVHLSYFLNAVNGSCTADKPTKIHLTWQRGRPTHTGGNQESHLLYLHVLHFQKLKEKKIQHVLEICGREATDTVYDLKYVKCFCLKI